MSQPLASTDPSDIANAARCFSCVVSPGEQIALRTYLLDQTAQIVGPPCITPNAPTRVTTGHIPPTSTTMNVAWSQKNSGSFITGYEVFWGTTSGGPYTNNSGVLPAAPTNYTITGLSPGTTYFIVVQAIAFAGCVSANSAEVSNTTQSSICGAGTTFATAWAARVVVNGGANPSAATQQVVATAQCSLIAKGLDVKMISWSLIVPDSLVATFSPQLPGDDSNTLWQQHNFGAGDLTFNGLIGDGATKFIDPLSMINIGTRSAQSISIFVYTSVAGNATNGRSGGGIQSVSGNPGLLVASDDNTNADFGLNGANPGNLITTATHGAGFYCDTRVSNVDHRLFYGSSGTGLIQIGATDVTPYNGLLPDSDPKWFCVNQGGSALLFSNERLSLAGVAIGLTPADVGNLFTIFQTARQSLGGGFV